MDDPVKNKRSSSYKDKRLPAVPPCLTLLDASTLQSAITLLARNAGVASQLLGSRLRKNACVAFHLALRGPFTETASVRIAPSRTLCETVPQFYFPVIGLVI